MADAHDPTILAAVLAIALGIVKVIESLATWGFRKWTVEKEPKMLTVQLDPNSSQLLRDVHSLTTKTNNDGTPLVYGPRTEVHAVAAALDTTNEKLDDIETKSDSILEAVTKKQ